MGSDNNNKARSLACLILRLLTVVMLALSIYFITTDTVRYSFGQKTNFTDLIGYRYVLATSSIGLIYSLLQIPCTIYLICIEKKTKVLKAIFIFSIYGDQIIGFLLAIGIGAGFADSVDTKRLVRQVDVIPEVRSKLDYYLNKGNIATSFLFIGFLSIATTSIIYSVIRTNDNEKSMFG